MRQAKQAVLIAVILITPLMLGGCAAAMGTVAGDLVGGTGWVAMKSGKLALKGGTFAAKTTGRTVVGAAKGVHEEFSKPNGSNGTDAQNLAPASPASRFSTFDNRIKDQGRIAALSQGQGAGLAD
jgi:hypothetical protein